MITKITIPIMMFVIMGFAFIKSDNKVKNKAITVENGFAVVELFTSEGCSSCPPADALVAKIEKENATKPVYILAYHVDYWDRLGWKDTFSQAKFSDRQNQYAEWLKLQSVYTPQIVVNGSKEFVGSDESVLRKSILAALSNPIKSSLKLSINKQSITSLSLNYSTDQKTEGYNLLVALVSPTGTNKILKGENKGKTLSHVQIVRQFETTALQGKTSGVVNLNFIKSNGAFQTEVIAFLQDIKTGKISAATKIETANTSI
jgi:hypothetical protein